MHKKTLLLSLFSFLFLQDCVEPFYPDVTNYENVFVVDGLITNEVRPYIIRLSRTLNYAEKIEKPVSRATVYIEDGEGNQYPLAETNVGIYKSDPSLLVGEIGKSYKLTVETADGEQFESAFEKIQQVPEIDRLFWEHKSYETDNKEKRQGIQVYLDTHSPENNTRYYAWEYKETWKIQSPFISQKINSICWNKVLPENGWTNMHTGDFFMVDSNYQRVDPVIENSIVIKEGFDSLVIDTIYYCWNYDPENFSWQHNVSWNYYLPPEVGNLPTNCYASDSSKRIIIATSDHLQQDVISKQPILLVSDRSNRLYLRYTLEVFQYSLSEESYTYWSHLQSVNSNTGSLFDPIPSSVIGNISNISNPDQPVLGFFQASAVTSKRIYIDRTEIPLSMRIPSGFDGCESIEIATPEDYVYYLKKNYVFIDHYFYQGAYRSILTNFLYCTDCSTMGSAVKPDFWVDGY